MEADAGICGGVCEDEANFSKEKEAFIFTNANGRSMEEWRDAFEASLA